MPPLSYPDTRPPERRERSNAFAVLSLAVSLLVAFGGGASCGGYVSLSGTSPATDGRSRFVTGADASSVVTPVEGRRPSGCSGDDDDPLSCFTVAHWPLHDAPGGVVVETVLGMHGQLVADARAHDGALSLHGGYVEVPHHDALNFGQQDFSVDMWFRDEGTDTIGVLIDKRTEVSGPVQGFVVSRYARDNHDLVYQFSTGGRESNLVPDAFIVQRGRWYHLLITVDRDGPDGARAYVDGRLVRSDDARPYSGNLNTPAPLRIGRRSDHPSWPGLFTGSIHDLRFFVRAIPEHRVVEVMRSTQPGATDG
jgi:hypothetical protein